MRRAEAGIQVDKFYPPTDWLDNNNNQIDIRKNAENNSIVLLVGHSADFSKYSLLSLLANTSSGTYDVYIEDVLVGSGITPNTQYDIDFSTINTSYGSATTPESLVLHKVVVKPTTSGEKITRFRCSRTTGITNIQQLGVVWLHIESSSVNIGDCLGQTTYNNKNCLAITSKGNILYTTMAYALYNATQIKYVPFFINNINSNSWNQTSNGNKNIKRRIIEGKNTSVQTGEYQATDNSFSGNENLEHIVISNKDTKNSKRWSGFLANAYKLKILPFLDYTNMIYAFSFITNAKELYPTKLDLSKAKSIAMLTCYGTSTYPMRGLRGLKVSNEAPFSGASPQINVSYTGLDRDALVELFQSLPTVTGGQTLSLVGATGNILTKINDIEIDEDGIASNFSAGSASTARVLTIPAIANLSKRFHIHLEFTPNRQAFRIPLGRGVNSAGGVYFDGTYNNMCTLRVATPSVNLINKEVYYTNPIIVNDKHSLDIVYDGEKTFTFILKNIVNNTICCQDTNIVEDKVGISAFTFGATRSDQYYVGYYGSIDLEKTFINVDRNYIMKGYLTDTDKAIATDKGWGLVLS